MIEALLDLHGLKLIILLLESIPPTVIHRLLH
jgi:hypothetical protein